MRQPKLLHIFRHGHHNKLYPFQSISMGIRLHSYLHTLNELTFCLSWAEWKLSQEIIMRRCARIFACGFHQIVFPSQIALLCSRRQCGKVSRVWLLYLLPCLTCLRFRITEECLDNSAAVYERISVVRQQLFVCRACVSPSPVWWPWWWWRQLSDIFY